MTVEMIGPNSAELVAEKRQGGKTLGRHWVEKKEEETPLTIGKVKLFELGSWRRSGETKEKRSNKRGPFLSAQFCDRLQKYAHNICKRPSERTGFEEYLTDIRPPDQSWLRPRTCQRERPIRGDNLRCDGPLRLLLYPPCPQNPKRPVRIFW